LLASSEKELRELTTRLDKTVAVYAMEISAEKSKVMITGKQDYISSSYQHWRYRPRTCSVFQIFMEYYYTRRKFETKKLKQE